MARARFSSFVTALRRGLLFVAFVGGLTSAAGYGADLDWRLDALAAFRVQAAGMTLAATLGLLVLRQRRGPSCMRSWSASVSR
jgi:hypothetical protein